VRPGPADDASEIAGESVVRTCDIHGSSAILVLEGQVDLVAADEFDRCLKRCREAGCSFVTVDMSHVTFLDSVGLRVLLSPLRYLPLESLVVRAPSPQVKRLLQLTGLEYLIAPDTPND
jgi:anti-anti-sigma factor